MSSKPFVAQWAIIGCGWISSEFVTDICRLPSTRKVTDISHAIATVGSRSVEKAEEFIKKFCPNGAAAQKEGLVEFKPKACGSYKEAMTDPNVHVVYVGTVNTCHYDDAKMALDAGKHVLLEKPATLNAAEWKSLSTLAKEKKLFLMEAVWTRFNPVMLAIQKAVNVDKVIGDIHALHSEFSMDLYGRKPDTNRILSAELGGGGLLDVGPYPMVWAMMLMYRHPENNMSPPENVGGTMLLHSTGVDLASSFAMPFPKIKAMAYCITTLFSSTDKKQNTRIIGSKGEIIVQGHTSRPQRFTVRRFADPAKGGREFKDEFVDMSFEEFGLVFEADEVARCLKDGLLESPSFYHKETQLAMEIFDKLRHDGGYKFPPGLERVQLS